MFIFLPLKICNHSNFCLIIKIRTAGYLLIFVACIDICLKKDFYIPMSKTVDTHNMDMKEYRSCCLNIVMPSMLFFNIDRIPFVFGGN